MSSEFSVITTTCPNQEMARQIAKILVESGLAACVQMSPIESVYTWQGKICEENEIVLHIKSKTKLFDKIATTIKEIHTYDVPEIIQTPITGGLSDYLNWIDNSTTE
ncbi:MAG: divalent-cation tolerance protein CutA [Bacteroidales bacterium]|nr:divalent-cation tolerance protein CutA [Bacteroidales bacterium]